MQVDVTYIKVIGSKSVLGSKKAKTRVGGLHSIRRQSCYIFLIKLCQMGAQTCAQPLFCDSDLEINPMTLKLRAFDILTLTPQRGPTRRQHYSFTLIDIPNLQSSCSHFCNSFYNTPTDGAVRMMSSAYMISSGF